MDDYVPTTDEKTAVERWENEGGKYVILSEASAIYQPPGNDSGDRF